MIEGFRVTSTPPPRRLKRLAKLCHQQDSFLDTSTRFTHRGGSFPVSEREAIEATLGEGTAHSDILGGSPLLQAGDATAAKSNRM